MVGTGIELTRFLDEIVDLQDGVSTLFADLSGAISARHRLIFASLVKPEGQKSLADQLLDRESDRVALRETMSALAASGDGVPRVLDRFVESGGRPDPARNRLRARDRLVRDHPARPRRTDAGGNHPGRSRLRPHPAGKALVLVHLVLRRLILDPLGRLEQAMLREVRDGDLNPAPLAQASGEIGRLTQHFEAMAGAIRAHTAELEAKVRERTDALHRLARIDPLTNLTNRRGMSEMLEPRSSARNARAAASACCGWMSITSRRSTTAAAMVPATRR